MRAVLDTNVLLSALARPGRLARLPELWKEKRIQLLMDEGSLRELQRVLNHPRLALGSKAVDRLLNQQIIPYVEPARPFQGTLPFPCKDADDDLFLRLALGGKAKALVTGDKALLALAANYDFEICAPRVFLDRYFPDFMASENFEAMTRPPVPS